MSRLLGFDAESHLLWIEDLGDQGDLMDIYRKRKPTAKECEELTDYLLDLHRMAVAESARGALENRAMRELNHEHQYNFPLRSSNGSNLGAITPGLASIAGRLKTDERYCFCFCIAQLGRAYLGEGRALLHGDFSPGSWLGTEKGVAVLDPEFCFLGPAECDLGVILAHLVLAGSTELWASVAERYAGEADWTLARAFAGAKLMRRLIGVAQLPLAADLRMKREWLEQSREMVCAI